MDEPRPTKRALRIEQSPLERARLWAEILAFLAAGCWAIYTFVYETRIAPALLPAHEVATVNVQRLAESPAGYVERIELTLRNDGSADVDTAALAVDVYATDSPAFSNLASNVTPFAAEYGTLPASAWKIVASSGRLLDGAISGRRGNHLILRPGDSLSLQSLAVVPRRYRTIRVYVEERYDRYPITPRVDVQLVKRHGEVLLNSPYTSLGFDAYFRV